MSYMCLIGGLNCCLEDCKGLGLGLISCDSQRSLALTVCNKDGQIQIPVVIVNR